jgi:amino acid transporter
MAQVSLTPAHEPGPQKGAHGKASLGPLLCWAVVFADIGSSIYYVPGILYTSVGGLAGFFVLLTMIVFVLLALKYAEVSSRFPEGGGVVSVAAQGLNVWAGAVGGIFILVSYFLTAAISCLSSLQYLAVVIPALLPYILWITIGVLFCLGILNWVGISESAKVSMVAALLAFASNLAVLWTVFSHISPAEVIRLFLEVLESESLTLPSILVGFAGAFLAFSGLESISQLSPVMKTPRKKVIGLALLLVVLTIGITSPLLTMLSTLLQREAAGDEVLSTQLISLLGGHWGNVLLQTEVAISASLILMFASNTAIIGAYHVFLALSRMDFLPSFILTRNRFRNTPHYSIALATGIPILVLLLVNGQITLLGDMYAFGLLGAFTLTCIGLDVIRYRERRTRQALEDEHVPQKEPFHNGRVERLESFDAAAVSVSGQLGETHAATNEKYASFRRWRRLLLLWKTVDFWLGILTTLLVLIAWIVGLFSKPLGTAFGGSVVFLGLVVSAVNYARRGQTLVLPTPLEGRIPGSVLAILMGSGEQNEGIIRSALDEAQGRPVVFLYLSDQVLEREPRPFEIIDPYLEDAAAKETLSRAEQRARKLNVTRRYGYRHNEPGIMVQVWRLIQPTDVVLAAKQLDESKDISPDRIRYETTPHGKVVHLVKHW